MLSEFNEILYRKHLSTVRGLIVLLLGLWFGESCLLVLRQVGTNLLPLQNIDKTELEPGHKS